MSDNISAGTSLEDFVHATQFIQAEAITSAFSSWRGQFTGGVPGACCAGALVWQLNDVVSKTSTDHGFAAVIDKACPAVALHELVDGRLFRAAKACCEHRRTLGFRIGR